ncbi:MAG: matrixin family metalloprotease [Acidobacteriota bacterium]
MYKILKILAVLLLLSSFSRSTIAYTTQFADDGEIKRLHWKGGVIPIALSTSLTKQNLNIKADSDVLGAVRRSLETWEKVANIKFEVTTSDNQSVSPSGKSGDGVSLITIAQTTDNLILFGSDSEAVSARTRIFYNGKGLITEADIVLNPYQQFSSDGSIGTFDLEATLTHEIGHLLGLEHSTIIGATMHAHQGKNGIYNLPGYSSRTLAEDDISGIRALYGAEISNKDCCGTISGKILTANGEGQKNYQVWAENSETGQVAAGVLTNSEGNYLIEGLSNGDYKLYAQDFSEKKRSAEEIEEITLVKGKNLNLVNIIKNAAKDFDVQYIGFNGQLSELAVPVNSGNTYIIYIGGKNLDVKTIEIKFNSPYFTATPKTISKLDYGSELSVVSFEIKVIPGTPLGEYSFCVKNKDDKIDYIVGGLTVESFINPWNSYPIF